MSNVKSDVRVEVRGKKPSRKQRASEKVTVKVNNPKSKTRRRSSSRGSKPAVKIAYSFPKSTRKRNSKARARTIQIHNRTYSGAIGGSPDLVRKYVTQALLPYNCTPTRILEETDTNSDPTAVTSNIEYYDLNLTELMQTNMLDPTDVPTPGQLPGGVFVWGDLSKGVPVVSTMDSRLLAIVPSRTLPGPLPRIDTVGYRSSNFVNPSQLSPGQFQVITCNLGDNVPPSGSLLKFVDPEGVLWLDLDDLSPISNDPNYLAPYGPIHPVLDAGNSRYFWVDAHSTGSDMDAKQENGSCIRVNLVPRGTLTVNVVASGLENTLRLVVQRLSTSTNEVDALTYSAIFPDAATDVPTGASALIQVSGYYRVGLSGAFADPGSTVTSSYFDSCIVDYYASKHLNVFSRHIVNTNLLKITDHNSRILMVKEQCLSSSMLISNETPAIVKGGRAYATTLPNGMSWSALSSSPSTIRSVQTNANRKYAGDLSHGAYGWLHCNNYGFRSFNEVISFQTSGSYGVLRSYSLSQRTNTPLTQLRGANVYYLVPPSQSNPINSGLGAAIFTLCMTVNIEYTTTSLIPVTAPVRINQSAIIAMKNTLMYAPTFTENSLHIADLKKVVEMAGNFYKKHRGAFQAGFGALAAFGHPIAKALGSIGLVLDDAFT